MKAPAVAGVIKLSSAAAHDYWEIPILYEDAHLLALDKPSGLRSSPDRLAPDQPSLLRLLHAGIAEAKPWARDRGLTYLMHAHRLGPETSGILLFAKCRSVLVTLADLFGENEPRRRYVALVQGAPPEARFKVDAKLAPHLTEAGFVRVDPRRGKRSRTTFEVLERFAGWTLLRCEPFEDRPHQIRAHLRLARLPIAADQLYGGKPLLLSGLKTMYRLKPNRSERPLLSRAALHAESLVLPHPATGAQLEIHAPWPKDLMVAVKYLRRYSTADRPGSYGSESRASSSERL